MKIDYSMFLNKPVVIGDYNWTTTQSKSTDIINGLAIPSALFDRNEFLKIPWNSACFYNMEVELNFQVAGSPLHSGVLAISAVPIGTPIASVAGINSLLAAPHGFFCSQTNPQV